MRSPIRRFRLFLSSVAAAATLLACGGTEQEWNDSRAVAERVHSQMRSGNYAAVYRESAPRFKGVGSEEQFVSLMQKFDSENGALKNRTEIAFAKGVDTNAGDIRLLYFDLEFERGRMNEKMTFTRSESGQMQLWKLEIQPKQAFSQMQ
jgi:hypothetical protein